jgi:hypothetical protein
MERKVLLLSYPRSGNSLVKYFIKRSIDVTEVNDCRFQTAIKKGKDITFDRFGKNFFFKEHFAEYCTKFDNKDDILVLVLRNYKECLPRHSGTRIGINNFTKQEIKKYVSNILFYENWVGPKICLYYEELIISFEKTYSCVLPVLGDIVDMKKHNDLFKNLQVHKDACLKQYTKVCGSHTYGKSVIFHSKKLTKEVKQFMDINVSEALGIKLMKKYLNNYA